MSPSLVGRSTRRILIGGSSIQQLILPSFLVPTLCNFNFKGDSFSTSAWSLSSRDYNRNRGVSSVRRSGPRQPLSVSNEPLPRPVLDPKKRSKIAVDDDHGLWEFFHSRDKPMNTPEEDHEHGRPWSAEELRYKNWEDLHALWWVCCKERNRIATESYERQRLEAGYGAFEAKRRDTAVRRTQRAIKQVLTERFYSWDDARKLARDDPEVDLSGKSVAYTPSDLEESLNDEDGYEGKLGEEREYLSDPTDHHTSMVQDPTDLTTPAEKATPSVIHTR